MRKMVALLVSALLCVTSVFGLAACEGETKGTYDYGDMDISGIYDDVLGSMYETYDQTDGRITLPTAGTEYYAVDYYDNTVKVRLDKVEYETTVYKSMDEVCVDIKVYCTVIDGEGTAGLKYGFYDKDGYLMEDGYLVKEDVSVGDKIVFEDYVTSEIGYAKYLLGGYRYKLSSVPKE